MGPLRPGILKLTRRTPLPAKKLMFVEPFLHSPVASPALHDTAQPEELHALPEGDPADSVATSDLPSTAPSVSSDALKDDTFKLNEEQLLWL